MKQSNLITCQICLKTMASINNKHLGKHGITPTEYKAKYPGFPLVCEAISKKISETAQRTNAPNKGKKRSEKDIAAIRNGVERNLPHRNFHGISENTREKMNEGIRKSFENGRAIVHTEETKLKISNTLRTRTKNE